MIGISACLGGCPCRYDGKEQGKKQLIQLVEEKQAVMICPEVLGGLSTPRDPAEICGGDGFDVWQNQATVQTHSGTDVTDAFKAGAITAYQQLSIAGITEVVLKESSPSCGKQMIYDGSFSGSKQAGVGVTTAYLLNQGLTVYSDYQWEELHNGN